MTATLSPDQVIAEIHTYARQIVDAVAVLSGPGVLIMRTHRDGAADDARDPDEVLQEIKEAGERIIRGVRALAVEVRMLREGKEREGQGK